MIDDARHTALTNQWSGIISNYIKTNIMEQDFEENSNYQRNFNNGDPRWAKPQNSGCFDTGLKVGCGFILGVLMILFVISFMNRDNTQVTKTDSEENTDSMVNYQTFELSTKKGIVKLHTCMSKDSVKILMGRPQTTSVNSVGSEVYETWEYKGRNHYSPEFTIEFTNGELESVDQSLEPKI